MKNIWTFYNLFVIALLSVTIIGCNSASYKPTDTINTDSALPAITDSQENEKVKKVDINRPVSPSPPDNALNKNKVGEKKKSAAQQDVFIHRVDTSINKKIPGTDTVLKKTDSLKNVAPVIDIGKINNEGLVVWELPETMRTFVESSVKVRIATIANQQYAKAGIDSTKKNSGSENIEIGEKMKVSLEAGEDSDFIIVAKDIIHTIPGKKYAEWFWTVTPLKPGTRFLILKVSLVTMVNGKEIPAEENSVLSKQFTVKVTVAYVASTSWNFIKSNWAIITAIITFFAGLLVRNKIKGAKQQAP